MIIHIFRNTSGISKFFRFLPSNREKYRVQYRILQDLVKENNAELVKKFLDDEVYLDLNIDEDKYTPPLSIAASMGNAEVVELLCNFYFFLLFIN